MHSQTDEDFELNTSHHSRRSENCSVPETLDEKKKTVHMYLCLKMWRSKQQFICSAPGKSTGIETKLSVLISLFHEH